MSAVGSVVKGLIGKGTKAFNDMDFGALKDLQGNSSVLLGERETPLPLSDFLKMLPEDFELTVSSVAEEINRLPDELDDIKFNLLRELREKYPEKKGEK